jgi:hypothetical protein
MIRLRTQWMRHGRPAFGLLLAAAWIAAAGCRGGREKDEAKPEEETVKGGGKTGIVQEEKKPCFEPVWGPIQLSSGKHDVVGLGAATGVGQVGVLWLETKVSGSEVYFTRIAGSDKEGTLTISSGGSAYPPAAAAWTGKEFALAWGDDRFRRIEVFVGKVSSTGKVTMKGRQFTQTVPANTGDVYDSDSSQEAALAYYDGNLLMVWGGPGDQGRQQVYHTTVSKTGRPIYAPYEITKGPFNHTGMNLVSSDEGASLHFCVRKGEENDIFRVLLTGTPPSVDEAPQKIAGTTYSPCWSTEVSVGDKRALLWADRIESQGVVTNPLHIIGVMADGSFDEPREVEDVGLVKFPGKFRRAFDAAECGGRVAVVWVDEPPEEETELRAGIFGLDGKAECRPLGLESRIGPTDPRVLYSGHGMQYVVLWVDREMGGTVFSLYAAGIKIP